VDFVSVAIFGILATPSAFAAKSRLLSERSSFQCFEKPVLTNSNGVTVKLRHTPIGFRCGS